MSTSKVLIAAAQSASYHVILQFTFRIVTFLLNSILLRFITEELLGIVYVRLTLLYSTIIFISREPIRRACLTNKITSQQEWQSVINLSWMAVPASCFLAILLGLVWSFLLSKPDIAFYYEAVAAFAFSAVIEALSQPFSIAAQIGLFVKLRVVVEGLALFLRSCLTLFFVIYFPNWGLIGFCVAQIVYCTAFGASYLVYFGLKRGSEKASFPFNSVRSFFPSSARKPFLDPERVRLTYSLIRQSVVKQFLTEGERYVMTVFGMLTFAEQGVYEVISNLGSLVARLVFAQIEDGAYLYFSQTLQRGVKAADQKPEDLKMADQVLSFLLRLQLLCGLIILFFGIPFSSLALFLYGGTTLTSGVGPLLLKVTCVYVLLLAINGITECFHFAAMSQTAVDRYNWHLVIFSGLFLLFTIVLTPLLGAVGFIVANCLNMAFRIGNSAMFIRNFFASTQFRPLDRLIPPMKILVAFSIAFTCSMTTQYLFYGHGASGNFLHFLCGAGSFAAILLLLYRTEKQMIDFIREHWRKSKKE